MISFIFNGYGLFEYIYWIYLFHQCLITMCSLCCWVQSLITVFETVSWCCWGLCYTVNILWHVLSTFVEAWRAPTVFVDLSIFLLGSIVLSHLFSRSVNLGLLTDHGGSALLSLWHDLPHCLHFLFSSVFLLWHQHSTSRKWGNLGYKFDFFNWFPLRQWVLLL